MYDPPSLPAAGWYPDPHQPGSQRWWDGREWDSPHLLWPADALPDIGEWLTGSFSNAFSRWIASATIAVMTSVPASVVFAVAIRRAADRVVISGGDIDGWTNDRLPATIVLSVLGTILTVVGTLAVNILMLRTVDGEPAGTTAGDEMRSGVGAVVDGIRVVPRAIGWMLVLMLAALAVVGVLVALVVVAAPLGVIAVIAIIPFGVYLAVALAFVVQSIIDRPGQPFTRSRSVSRDRWWPTFGRLLLIGLITWLISAAVQSANAASNGAGFGAAFGQRMFETNDDGTLAPFEAADLFPTSPLSVVVGAAVAVVLMVCVSSVSSAAFARLYRTRNPRPITETF